MQQTTMQSSTSNIFCCPVATVDATLLESYRLQLTRDELTRYEKFRSPTAQREFVISRALLRSVLTTHLSCDYATLQFQRNDDGKPLLPEPFTHWHFSLSHSRYWVAVALSNVGPVGIDVETRERGNNLSGIAQRFYSAAENNSLDNLNDAQWRQQFFAIWTLKEAHGKALGTGLSKILSCSSFVVARAARQIAMQLEGVAASTLPLHCRLYDLPNDTALAIAQLGAPIENIKLFCGLPSALLMAAGNYREMAPIAIGNWSPTALLGAAESCT